MSASGTSSAIWLDGDHPEEQGLKLDVRYVFQGLGLLDGDHPEEQGLKHGVRLPAAHRLQLDGDHPEEQGLKPVGGLEDLEVLPA